jgi:hypothetical protein
MRAVTEALFVRELFQVERGRVAPVNALRCV